MMKLYGGSSVNQSSAQGGRLKKIVVDLSFVALFLMVGMVAAVATYHCVRILNFCSSCQRAALGATVWRGDGLSFPGGVG